MYPEDVDPKSGCRLLLPRREQLDDAGQRTYDSLADPKGGTIRGLRGPGGILCTVPNSRCNLVRRPGISSPSGR